MICGQVDEVERRQDVGEDGDQTQQHHDHRADRAHRPLPYQPAQQVPPKYVWPFAYGACGACGAVTSP